MIGVNDFKSLGLPKWLVETLNAMKITHPTEIQQACIPEIIKGRDCIGGAKTGSGKTIAFAAPMLKKWSEDPAGMFGVVLTPTRELAMQIAEQFTALGSSVNIKISVVVGGESIVQQAIDLQKKPHFIIATPGRLAHHIMNSGEDTVGGLRRAKYLVLDEADILLTNTFSNDLSVCMDILPPKEKRQNLLFTATMTDQVKHLKHAPSVEGKPPIFSFQVETLDQLAIPSTLETEYLIIPEHVKEAYIYQILTSDSYQTVNAIVFVNRTSTAEILRRVLRELGVRVTSLHSQMPQQERTNSLHRFKANAARILIATDVASRGLDIPNVRLVINYDISANPDTFIHRVGRTARAGRSGESICFVTQKDISRIEAIESRINKKMNEFKGVGDTAVIRKSLMKVTTAKREALMAMEKEGFGERRKVQKRKNMQEKTYRNEVY